MTKPTNETCTCDYTDFIVAGRQLNRKLIIVQCKCGTRKYEEIDFEPKGKESASEKEGGLGKIRTGTPSHGESLNTLPVAPSKPLEAALDALDVVEKKLTPWVCHCDSECQCIQPALARARAEVKKKHKEVGKE